LRIEAAGAGLLSAECTLEATLTVHALTRRAAAHIAASWRGYAG